MGDIMTPEIVTGSDEWLEIAASILDNITYVPTPHTLDRVTAHVQD